ncbi:MAG: XdhC family protein [Acidobacteriota bacterium]|nr:XdhC family protein [Acidobacteriota bacterium]
MTDLEPILDLWRAIKAEGKDFVLATIVSVDGPSYRKPGTCMLLAPDGRRAGTVSGGCLEAEVAKRAWWLTESGPTVESYSTVADDGEMPYGSGCGGTVHLLLERSQTADAALTAMAEAFAARVPLAMATVLEGSAGAQRAFLDAYGSASGMESLHSFARHAMEARGSFESKVELESGPSRVWSIYLPARVGLWIFSAGDDAKPLAQIARELGWWVSVVDGRSHLATPARFPMAHQVRVAPSSALPQAASSYFAPHAGDAAVVMTHSFEQDAHFVASLLAAEVRPGYIGVLGPQRRTRELLEEGARLLNLHPSEARTESWLDALHAPTGLDLQAETPAAIALSILAEIQKVLKCGTAQPLREVRAVMQETLRP